MPQASMLIVNIIGILILGLLLLIYKFVYPKKKINLLVLLILISILPTLSIFRTGVYESSDFSIHIFDSISFSSSLKEGILFPKWAGQLNANYGYPLFLYAFPLPYYFISSLHFLGFTFISSYKIFLTLSYILSGVTMYFWLKNLFGEKSGFFASIIYLFLPYHLIDLHFRATAGEILSFVLLPLILLNTRKLIYGNTKSIFYLSILIALLILTHQAISLAFMPIVIIYGLFEFKNLPRKKNISLINFIISVFFGLLISCYYWLPILLESKYTTMKITGFLEFPKLWELFISPYRLGFLFQGSKGELSPILGYAQWLIFFLSIYYIFNQKLKKIYEYRFTLLFVSLFLIVFFMITEYAKSIWLSIPIINNFQFTMRLLIIEGLFISALAGLLTRKISSNLLYILIAIAIFTTILNWGNRKMLENINDNYFLRNLKTSTANGEALQVAFPIWIDHGNMYMKSVPKQQMEIISGKSNITVLSIKSIRHVYKIGVSENTTFKENTLYYPGWVIYANNKKVSLSYENRKYPGVIVFKLPKGNYQVEIVFKNTALRNFAEIISIITICLLGIYLILIKRFTLSSKDLGKY